MTEFVRTAEENFTDLPGFAFAPNYHGWQDLRMHYLDEGLHPDSAFADLAIRDSSARKRNRVSQ